jgi:type III secretion system YscJ/HrcJ family lipoprotein
MTRHRIVLIAAVVLIAAFLASCGKVELYQNLSEEDANEILVLLSENGIKPTKKKEVKQNEVTYTIEVSEGDMVKARSLLLQHNLPRRKELGLTGVYKEKGLIPTPDEQKARYILALKGEIINSLRRVPQIVDADVVLNVPTKDEFASAEELQAKRPTASVVVRVKPDPTGVSPITDAKIQQFVSNAVEGMNPRDVTVVISYLPVDEKTIRPGDVQTLGGPSGQIEPAAGLPPSYDSEIMGLRLDPESKDRLKVYFLIFFLLLVVLSVALIVVIIQGSRMRRTLAALSGPAGERPAIEGHLMDEGPPRLEDRPPEDEL